MGELGNCRVCGRDASVVYPLLKGEPSFCSEHHNPKDAGPFGCDFSGPDDFDIPDFDLDRPYEVPIGPRGVPIWTTKDGREILISKMEDSHIYNCLDYVKRRRKDFESAEAGGDLSAWWYIEFYDAWIPLFEKEAKKRRKREKKSLGD